MSDKKCTRCQKNAEGYNRSKRWYCAQCWEQMIREEQAEEHRVELIYQRWRSRASQYERLRYEMMRDARYC